MLVIEVRTTVCRDLWLRSAVEEGKGLHPFSHCSVYCISLCCRV